MTEAIALFLLTDEGRALTSEAEALHAARTDALAALSRLRRRASAEQCAAAWEMAVLRPRAAAKFGPDAARMFVTRESLEQASGRRASAYHAARFVEMGAHSVADVCGGIGADALAFARAGLAVTLFEIDPVRALFAEANADALGLAEYIDVRREDVSQAEMMPGTAVWFDPARRGADGRRIGRPDDYVPPLPLAHGWAAQGLLPMGMKVSPAVDHALAAEYHSELEFISDGGECKEALLWRGALAPNSAHVRAVLLSDTGPDILTGDPNLPAPPETTPGMGYLYEPDPAVIRAHLVGTLAEELGACAPDTHIAYLTSDRLTPTLFARAYPILERFAYSRRALQEAVTRRGVGSVIIKKRGFPLEPDAVRKQLKLSGPESLIVVLARQGDGHMVYLCAVV